MKDFDFKVFIRSIWIFLIFLVVVGVTSCGQMAESHSITNTNSEKTEVQTEKTEVVTKDNSNNSKIASVAADDSIKQTDFKNFSYPWCSKIAHLKDTITLKGGKTEIIEMNGKPVKSFTDYEKNDYYKIDDIEYTVDDIYYGDFNSDNVTDAFVTIRETASSGKWVRSHGTCSYIYTIKEKKPKLVWQYNYGENKYTASRKIEFNKTQNEIIFEMYFPYAPEGKFVGQLYRETQSESYDRLTYKWKNNTFRLISTQNIPYAKLQIEQLGVTGLDE